MDDPIQDIGPIVHTLCQGPPNEQQAALEKYFLDNAAFYHPFCRVDSFPGSRRRLLAIFRWYKVMSPKIELEIQSVAYDEIKQILYVTIHQVFAIWFLFGLSYAPVTLTTVLHLEKEKGKYYIQSQNDLYQTDQFMRFCTIPRGIGGYFVIVWQWLATMGCIMLAHLFYPMTVAEQWYADQGKEQLQKITSKDIPQIGNEVKEKLQISANEVDQNLKKKTNGSLKSS